MVHFPFRCPVAGVSFRQVDIAAVEVGDEVEVVAERSNPHDPRAKRVDAAGRCIGYLPRAVSARLDGTGVRWSGRVVERYVANGVVGVAIEVTGGHEGSARAEGAAEPATEQAADDSTLESGRLVRVKRSGRVLGTLVGVERDRRQVLVATDRGVVAYPDGLVDLVD